MARSEGESDQTFPYTKGLVCLANLRSAVFRDMQRLRELLTFTHNIGASVSSSGSYGMIALDLGLYNSLHMLVLISESRCNTRYRICGCRQYHRGRLVGRHDRGWGPLDQADIYIAHLLSGRPLHKLLCSLADKLGNDQRMLSSPCGHLISSAATCISCTLSYRQASYSGHEFDIRS